MTRRNQLRATVLSLIPSALLMTASRADDTAGCTTLAQSAAAAIAARLAADNQTIKPPQSVTTLSCLDNFFNGTGLNVITNLLDPASLLTSVEAKICTAVQSEWQAFTSGLSQCGLTVTGFNVGFGSLGGGSFCPKLSFGGGGAPIGSIGTGLSPQQAGLFVGGTGVPPTGYTMPPAAGLW